MRKTNFFIVHKVEITNPGQLHPFELKFPGDVKRCIGYQISADRYHDTLSLATVTVSFNGARENTISRELIVRHPASVRRRRIMLSQKQHILQNSFVKGYVEDKAVAAIPYTVRIYFHLSTQ